METEAIIMVLLCTVVIPLGLFFLLREVFCWYWKINENIAVQKRVLYQLESLNRNIKHMVKEENQIKIQDSQQPFKNLLPVYPEEQDQEVSTKNKQESESEPAPEHKPKPQPDPTPKPEPKPKKPKKPYCPRCKEKNTFGEHCKFCGAELEDVDEE